MKQIMRYLIVKKRKRVKSTVEGKSTIVSESASKTYDEITKECKQKSKSKTINVNANKEKIEKETKISSRGCVITKRKFFDS